MGQLAPGDNAPAFELPTDSGGSATLSAYRGRKLVIFFYPGDDGSSCTAEAQDFTAAKADFEAAGAAVIGISPDSVKSHDKFKLKRGVDVTLASDEAKSVVEAYGVWQEKQMYGRSYMGVVRTTMLIDAEGRIARIWPGVKVKGHVADVLAATRAL